MDAARFLAEHEHAVNTIVYDAVQRFGGSISAEHGVGQLKRDEICSLQRHRRHRADARRPKRAFDPDNRLEPRPGGAAAVLTPPAPTGSGLSTPEASRNRHHLDALVGQRLALRRRWSGRGCHGLLDLAVVDAARLLGEPLARPRCRPSGGARSAATRLAGQPVAAGPPWPACCGSAALVRRQVESRRAGHVA